MTDEEARRRLLELLDGLDVFHGELDDVLEATGIDEQRLRSLAIPDGDPIGMGISPRGGVIVCDAEHELSRRSMIDLIVYRTHDVGHDALELLADAALQGEPAKACEAADWLATAARVLVKMSTQSR